MYFSEHQEFSKEIGDTKDPRIREDLERELDALVSRMEAKSHQISKIRKHQERVSSSTNARAKLRKYFVCHLVIGDLTLYYICYF